MRLAICHRGFKHGNSQGSPGYKNSVGELGATGNKAPVIMSTSLELENIPDDISPVALKKIVDSAADGTNGYCQGIYIFMSPNPSTGNKYGIAAMSGYFTAQRVCRILSLVFLS